MSEGERDRVVTYTLPTSPHSQFVLDQFLVGFAQFQLPYQTAHLCRCGVVVVVGDVGGEAKKAYQ